MRTTLTSFDTEARTLATSARFTEAKKELLATISQAAQRVHAVRPPSQKAGVREEYLETIQEFAKDRGRELYFSYLASGLGSGPFIELLDGSVKYDMIAGIGVNFFGHSNPDLMAAMIDGLGADVMQGNLQPGFEAKDLAHELLEQVGSSSKLKHCWLTTCGTMANEIALKIIRQKKSPATKVLAFQDCFAGRSTAMQEITDNPKYREGQPVYGEAHWLPFYDSKQGVRSTERTLATMKEHLARYPGKFAALMLEVVQGEGGFNFAPREFYVAVFEEAKKAGLAIWADEIQTFGRTGALFAYQKFELEPYIDVATVAKALQASVVLFSEEYNPKAGLVAGTFTGSSTQLRASRRALEILVTGGNLGPNGKIARLSGRFEANLRKLADGSCKGLLSEIRVLGGMIAFMPMTGKMDQVKALLMRLFDQGCVAFYCGHDPYLVRMLPPLTVMEEKDVDEVCRMIGQALVESGRPA